MGKIEVLWVPYTFLPNSSEWSDAFCCLLVHWQRAAEFNVPLDTEDVNLKTSLSGQSIALVLTELNLLTYLLTY